jgi:hypothetical protein
MCTSEVRLSLEMLGQGSLVTVLAALSPILGLYILGRTGTVPMTSLVVSQDRMLHDQVWAASPFLADRHQAQGLTCGTCHTDPRNPRVVSSDICMGCHDPEKVSAATAVVQPTNPHNSPHYGKQADCNLCHHQHEKSEDFCANCHGYNFRVP